jgi:hypothetical protein
MQIFILDKNKNDSSTRLFVKLLFLCVRELPQTRWHHARGEKSTTEFPIAPFAIDIEGM